MDSNGAYQYQYQQYRCDMNIDITINTLYNTVFGCFARLPGLVVVFVNVKANFLFLVWCLVVQKQKLTSANGNSCSSFQLYVLLGFAATQQGLILSLM